jgi:hypothetical protein
MAEWPGGLNEASIKGRLREVLLDYHRHEVAVCPAEDKDIDFLLCVKEPGNTQGYIYLWEIRGPVVRRVETYSLLGWDEAIYKHDIQSHYKQEEKSLFSMLLGVHLCLLAKNTSNNIGGPTQVVIANGDGISQLAPERVAELEQRVTLFDEMLDDLRFRLSDTSIAPEDFEDALNDFRDTMIRFHLDYTLGVLLVAQEQLRANPDLPDLPTDPYLSIPEYEKLADMSRFQRETSLATSVYELAKAGSDLAVSTVGTRAAVRDAYTQGLLTLEQKDRLENLLETAVESGERVAEMLQSFNTRGVVLIPPGANAEMRRIFLDGIVWPYVQFESELANLPDASIGTIRAALEDVRASLLIASKKPSVELEN